MVLIKHLTRILCLCAALCAPTGVQAAAPKQPVVFVLAAGTKVVITNHKGQRYSALPTQRLALGHEVQVPRGQRFSVMVLKTGNRRVYWGPAKLRVIADTVRVLKGPAVKVFPLDQADQDLVEQWLVYYPRKRPQAETADKPLEESATLRAIAPRDGAMLLTRNPEFRFEGKLPREGNLMLFDGRGKRFWVQPLEDHWVTLPPAADFQWGQQFTWEVRKLTGGRVASGSFSIASEETARSLLAARVPDLPGTLPESRALYGMRLQLAKAYTEADEVWHSLGLSLDEAGQPHRLKKPE
ncbi:MAG TPA: hypothetical protein VFV43_03210 [Limnobacter sp.]|nr:hypothetical protein [Limnobacter sp.]